MKSNNRRFGVALVLSFRLVRIRLLLPIRMPSSWLHRIGRIRSLLLSVFIIVACNIWMVKCKVDSEELIVWGGKTTA